MATSAPVVEPRPGVAPAPPAAPAVEPAAGAPPAEDTAASLPPELIQIPAIQGLLSGAPPATSMPIEGFDQLPEGKAIIAGKDSLMNAGFGFYRSLAGDIGAIFNRAFVADNEITDADKAGKLLEIAPPFDQVNLQLSQSGQGNPLLSAQAPTGMKTAGAAAPLSMPTMPQAKTGQTPARTVQAKLRNLTVGSPTEGPKPGAGRIMNQLLKPVV